MDQESGIYWIEKKNSYYDLYSAQALSVDTGRMVDAEFMV
jgi:hypothetical protein